MNEPKYKIGEKFQPAGMPELEVLRYEHPSSSYYMNYVKRLEDLPVPKAGVPYGLPNWNKTTGYRATAWAYLTREDGGNVVTLGDEQWSIGEAPNRNYNIILV